VEINVPAGTRGAVGLPVQESSDSLSINGRRQKGNKNVVASDWGQASRNNYIYTNDLAPGTYQITVAGGH
jgi:hypothetical protein